MLVLQICSPPYFRLVMSCVGFFLLTLLASLLFELFWGRRACTLMVSRNIWLFSLDKNVPLSALYRISVKERLVLQYSMFKDNNTFSSATLQLQLGFLWSLISWNIAFMQKSFSDVCSVMYCSRLTDDTLRRIRHRKQRRQGKWRRKRKVQIEKEPQSR